MPVIEKTNAKLLVSVFSLFCFSLLLTAYSARNDWTSRLGQMILSGALDPLQRVSHSLRSHSTDLWSHYFALVETNRQNDALRVRLARLEHDNSQLLEQRYENERLQKLLGAYRDSNLNSINAKVIGYSPSNWVRSIVIDLGLKDGVEQSMAVLTDQGVVGQVINAAGRSSQVLLITDHISSVDVMIQRTRARGLLAGSHDGNCQLLYVLPEEILEAGDRIITSGVDGIYPKGLVVGEVSSVTHNGKSRFQSVEVQPAVNFSRLENVLLVRGSTEEIQQFKEENG